ncbi:MAG TPA: RsmG family class I SAM-dependent methyltransferase [Acidimicrobiales bacterium]|nr:RsmG family class I SAM-dependent methyltransferase [Acidimicrobiales bacterium]
MSGTVDSTGILSELRSRVSDRIRQTLERSADLGFLGGMPTGEQIDHALGFVAAVESELNRPPRSVIDLGTGGGLPGLVLLSCWPSSRTVLLDANERRTAFLIEEVKGWQPEARVEVVRGRAEEIARDDRFCQQFEVLTSRSFGAPAVTAECGAPLVSVGGLMVVSEPPPDSDEPRWPEAGLAHLGLSPLTSTRFDDRFGYQLLRKAEPTPDRYPRRVGIPAKRPLF